MFQSKFTWFGKSKNYSQSCPQTKSVYHQSNVSGWSGRTNKRENCGFLLYINVAFRLWIPLFFLKMGKIDVNKRRAKHWLSFCWLSKWQTFSPHKFRFRNSKLVIKIRNKKTVASNHEIIGWNFVKCWCNVIACFMTSPFCLANVTDSEIASNTTKLMAFATGKWKIVRTNRVESKFTFGFKFTLIFFNECFLCKKCAHSCSGYFECYSILVSELFELISSWWICMRFHFCICQLNTTSPQVC